MEITLGEVVKALAAAKRVAKQRYFMVAGCLITALCAVHDFAPRILDERHLVGYVFLHQSNPVVVEPSVQESLKTLPLNSLQL